jgi:hypothetical protein
MSEQQIVNNTPLTGACVGGPYNGQLRTHRDRTWVVEAWDAKLGEVKVTGRYVWDGKFMQWGWVVFP